MGDLDGDGRAARIDGQRNTTTERQKARRACAHYALGTAEPRATLTELLDLLELRPAGHEPR